MQWGETGGLKQFMQNSCFMAYLNERSRDIIIIKSIKNYLETSKN